jgi:hypothetical protein
MAVSPSAISLTGSRSGTTRRRRIVHVLVGGGSWIALAALWIWQLRVYVPADWLGGVELIAVLFAGWSCLSVAWVAWCRNIYVRRHRRTAPLTRAVGFERDPLGRRIVAPPGIGAARGQILVSVPEHDVKRYRPAPLRQPDAVPAADRDAGRVARRRQGRTAA